MKHLGFGNIQASDPVNCSMTNEERVAEAIGGAIIDQGLAIGRDPLDDVRDWNARIEAVARAAIAALGPQLTAEEKDAIPLLLEAAQNYDTRLPAEQGGEAQHSLVAKLSLIAKGEKP